MVILLLDTTTLQVQEISQKSTSPKWPRYDQLDNTFYSTIQPPIFTTYNIKIGIWPAVLKFFDFLSQELIQTTQQNSHQTCKEVKCPHVIRSSSPVTNPSGELTDINVT